MKRVVITGYDIITPIGNTIEEVRKSFMTKESGVEFVPEWENIKGIKSFVAGTVKNFNEKLLDRKLRRSMGKLSIMNTVTAINALKHAGIPDEMLSSGRLGCAAASTIGSPHAFNEFFHELIVNKSIDQIQSMTFLKLMNHTTAANIAVSLGITGRVFSPSSACTSSSQSIGMAYEYIKYGLQDVMIAGGGEELHHTTVSVFDIMDVTCRTHNDNPKEASQPFSKTRGGVVVGEGAGIIVLEELERAKRRGAKIYGEIIGFSSLCDGHHMSTPSSDGMKATMEQAIEIAGINLDDIDYVNAHATATDTGDVAESQAMRELFGDKIPVSATKSFTGHTLGACGVHETVYSLMMMEDSTIYPTINLKEIDPRCEGLTIITDSTKKDLNIILSNNFAFGGINTSLLLKKYTE